MIAPAWVEPFIGIPYKLKGRTESGLDCYGLAIHVLKKQFNIEIPDEMNYPDHVEFSKDAEIAIESHILSHWIPVSDHRAGDLAVFKIHGIKSHIGIIIDYNLILHTHSGIDSCLIRLDDKNWAKRFYGCYRYLK